MKRLLALLATCATILGLTALYGPQAVAAAGCKVDYTVTSQWQGGFQAGVKITNLGAPVSGWTLDIAMPDAGQKLVQGWNATWSQSGSTVTAVGVDWNRALNTGAAAEVGLVGSFTGANPKPTAFRLNGVACTGSVGGTPSPDPDPEPGDDGTPVGINGQVHVCGVHLCNQYDRPVQLRGMSTHGIQWFSQCYNNASVDALANDWKADLLRVAMYVQEDGYETDPAGFTSRVNGLVDMAEARGMYALIDFHTLTPGDPNYNLDRAKTFFASVAARNAGKKNVIYEIANEPNGVSWTAIKNYAEQVIPVIRAADPDAVVIVGTRGWSSLGVSDGSSESEVVSNPVNATNIMYAFHFYAASHKDSYRSAVSRASSRLPLFVTEFGTVSATGGGALDRASSTAWLDLLDQLKIGYANWTYSDAPESSAALQPGTCDGSDYSSSGVLTESGTLLKSRISTPDNFPTS
ncbi:cellulase family glycosylhydrolase [Streptomyces sp. P01-B04]|uniref:cellulase family glycosylhydrolase n=1 Tax=Streptomyces poriferorum TaxID=2798799 RepID=UPI001C5FA91C|nr:cellulase family glycosylhydrolase [Streptomyces poriferorum]MBW5250142.1 cellulase family glycosylhydrolase [Streptomyces poriferorum]MBW5258509.1 cellulase family glycosylhydrolase [Streptomyces poriferorum]